MCLCVSHAFAITITHFNGVYYSCVVQIRREEPCLVHRTAAFGRLLALKEDAVELARLTDDVLEAQNRRPEGWLLAATYAQLKGELDSALALLDKVNVWS